VNIHGIHCIENFSPIRIFEKLAVTMKDRVCPENFHYVEYIFCHSGYLSNFALALKKSCLP